MSAHVKNGPIHFYPTNDRPAHLACVVEYCVQVGDKQPLTRTQAAWLVSSKQVSVDNEVVEHFGKHVEEGSHVVTVRGRNHHVVVFPPLHE